MRVWVNTLTILQSVWLNGRNVLKAAFRRQTCGCTFIMQVSGVSSKPWQIHRKGKHV